MTPSRSPRLIQLILQWVALAALGFLVSGVLLLVAQPRAHMMAVYPIAELPRHLLGLRATAYLDVGFICLMAAPATAVLATLVRSAIDRQPRRALLALGVLTTMAAGLLLSGVA